MRKSGRLCGDHPDFMTNETEKKVNEWVRPEIRALKAYHVPSAAGMVKLDAMENPYAWPPALVEEWLGELRQVTVNRYPDPHAGALAEALRAALGAPADSGLLLGNGSDELIQIILLALARPGRVVLASVPTFVMYEMLAVTAGMRFVGVPLCADFSLDLPAMLAAIERERPAVVFLAYPNNPTGNCFSRTDIEAILDRAPGLVVVDEAYHAFAGDSFLSQIAGRDNLVVMRTLSKQGLAGLRLGMLLGARAWLGEFDKVRLPYNINTLTQVSARFALRHLDVLDEQAARIRADRDTLARKLAAVPGITVWPSRANFLLFRTPHPAPAVFERLRGHGVLIKNLDAAHPLLGGCLRVTVGTPAENAAFLRALGQSLAALG